jgi:hypothetical protein
MTSDAEHGPPQPAGVVVPLRPCLGLLGVAALTLAMVPKGIYGYAGVYSRWNIAAVITAGLLFVAAGTLPAWGFRLRPVVGRLIVLAAALFLVTHASYRAFDPSDDSPVWAKVLVGITALGVAGWFALREEHPGSFPTALVGALALVLSGEAVFCCAVNPNYYDSAMLTIRLAAAAGFVLTAGLLVFGDTLIDRGRHFLLGQAALLFALGGALRVAAAVATPDPECDVYFAQQQGADHLLAGQNPYGPYYTDAGGSPCKGAPFYPPLPLLIGVPVRAVGLDVRVGNALCDVVAAVFILAVARSRGDLLLGVLLAAAYLNFPRAPLLMELAWYEPMLAALLGSGMYLAGRGWRVGHLLLGLGMTGKQFGVVFLPVLLKSFKGNRLASLCGLVLAGMLTILPFYAWDPAAFYDSVIDYHLNVKIRSESLTLQSLAINEFGVIIAPLLLRATAALLIGLLTYCTATNGASPAPQMSACLLVFCLFHNQAFFNYYYLCQYLMLLGLADWCAGDLAEASRFASVRRAESA